MNILWDLPHSFFTIFNSYSKFRYRVSLLCRIYSRDRKRECHFLFLHPGFSHNCALSQLEWINISYSLPLTLYKVAKVASFFTEKEHERWLMYPSRSSNGQPHSPLLTDQPLPPFHHLYRSALIVPLSRFSGYRVTPPVSFSIIGARKHAKLRERLASNGWDSPKQCHSPFLLPLPPSPHPSFQSVPFTRTVAPFSSLPSLYFRSSVSLILPYSLASLTDERYGKMRDDSIAL